MISGFSKLNVLFSCFNDRKRDDSLFQGTLVSSRGTGLVRTAISTPEKGMTTVRFAPFPSCVGGALAGFPMWIHARAFVHPHFPPPYPARRALTCQNRAMSVGGERGRRHARLFPRCSPPHAEFLFVSLTALVGDAVPARAVSCEGSDTCLFQKRP